MNPEEISLLSELEERHWWYKARRIKIKTWARGNISLGGHILDVGSAAGLHTLMLIDLGFHAEGLEYSDEGIEIQNKKKIPVTQGDARNLPWADSSFDGVICMDVLEHIDDDDLALHEILRVLKPGGRFLISVPAYMSLWSNHDAAVGHLRRYSKASIKELFRKDMVDSYKISNWNTLLFSIIALAKRRSQTSDLREYNSITNFVLYSILRIEDFLNLNFLPGVSKWISGKKRKDF